MGFTTAVSCMDASLYNKWLCLLISLFALSCLSVTSILWPCLAPLSLPFKSLPPLSKFTVCMRVSCLVHAHVWMHTQVLHETLWVFLSLDGSFPSFLFIQMLLPHVCVPGPSGPLPFGVGFVSCLCRSQCQDESARVTFFSCPFLLTTPLILQRSAGARLAGGSHWHSASVRGSCWGGGWTPLRLLLSGFCSNASAGRAFKELSPPVLFLYRERSRGPGE